MPKHFLNHRSQLQAYDTATPPDGFVDASLLNEAATRLIEANHVNLPGNSYAEQFTYMGLNRYMLKVESGIIFMFNNYHHGWQITLPSGEFIHQNDFASAA